MIMSNKIFNSLTYKELIEKLKECDEPFRFAYLWKREGKEIRFDSTVGNSIEEIENKAHKIGFKVLWEVSSKKEFSEVAKAWGKALGYLMLSNWSNSRSMTEEKIK